MFFDDGWWYLDPEGDVRGGTVLDNLPASGGLPPLVGVTAVCSCPTVFAGSGATPHTRRHEIHRRA